MAFTVGRYGPQSLVALARLMGCFYLTCVLFILVVLGAIARLHGFSVLAVMRYIREELFIVLGTSSSETVLPRMLAKLEDLGVRKSIVGLVIPAGYSFNLDGTSIYLTMAALYIAQATNTPLDLWHQGVLLAVLLLFAFSLLVLTRHAQNRRWTLLVLAAAIVPLIIGAAILGSVAGRAFGSIAAAVAASLLLHAFAPQRPLRLLASALLLIPIVYIPLQIFENAGARKFIADTYAPLVIGESGQLRGCAGFPDPR